MSYMENYIHTNKECMTFEGWLHCCIYIGNSYMIPLKKDYIDSDVIDHNIYHYSQLTYTIHALNFCYYHLFLILI